MKDFVEKRLNISEVKFWELLLYFKVEIFVFFLKKKKIRIVDEKILIVNVD